MLSRNRLTSLPEDFTLQENLELVRLARNQITALPADFFTMPRLAWVALAGNPVLEADRKAQPIKLPLVDFAEIEIASEVR